MEEVTGSEAIGLYLFDPSGSYDMTKARPMHCTQDGWTEILFRNAETEEPTVRVLTVENGKEQFR